MVWADIDECRIPSLCGGGSQCTNIPGSFECTCQLGYKVHNGKEPFHPHREKTSCKGKRSLWSRSSVIIIDPHNTIPWLCLSLDLCMFRFSVKKKKSTNRCGSVISLMCSCIPAPSQWWTVALHPQWRTPFCCHWQEPRMAAWPCLSVAKASCVEAEATARCAMLKDCGRNPAWSVKVTAVQQHVYVYVYGKQMSLIRLNLDKKIYLC